MKAAGKFKLYYSYTVIGVYFLAGLFLLIKGWYLLSPLQNHGMGLLLIFYAAFRLYRQLKWNKMDEEEALTEKE